MPDIAEVLSDGYTVLWAAVNQAERTDSKDIYEAVTTRLETQKANLMTTWAPSIAMAMAAAIDGDGEPNADEKIYYLSTAD